VQEDSVAGHNKWSQIKRKKAANDQKRGQMFTKLIREITVAAREGGGDPELNARLRLAVDTAKSANMPQDNIERAIKRGTGELEGVSYEEISYEGYAPGGVALYIEATTDNPRRTVQEIRHILEKNGGNLGTDGSVAWQFDRKGQIYVDADRYPEDVVLEAALDAGAEDVVGMDGEYVITTEATAFHDIQAALKRRKVAFTQAELAMIPQTEIPVAGADAERVLRLLDRLHDHDDGQKVSSTANIDDSLLAEAVS
jgi:YebC/PmpR family DNA-binding regulatory protein